MNGDAAIGRSWTNSNHVCALADHERHLGHVVKGQIIGTDQWHAWDATHADEGSARFNYLGAFADRAEAMQAVESAVARVREPESMGMGGQTLRFQAS